MKLNCDEPLSNIGFNFNLRRYIEGLGSDSKKPATETEAEAETEADVGGYPAVAAKVEMGVGVRRRQGHTLVRISAQPEPCLTQGNTLHTLNTP